MTVKELIENCHSEGRQMIKPIVVEVYLNSHATAWSIRCKGKVIGHSEYAVNLKNATFHVQEAGRLRSIKEGRKNVHAWIKGELILDQWTMTKSDQAVTKTAIYEPKKHKSFVNITTKRPVKKAAYVQLRLINENPCVWYG